MEAAISSSLRYGLGLPCPAQGQPLHAGCQLQRRVPSCRPSAMPCAHPAHLRGRRHVVPLPPPRSHPNIVQTFTFTCQAVQGAKGRAGAAAKGHPG
jgi:hypothetical protein